MPCPCSVRAGMQQPRSKSERIVRILSSLTSRTWGQWRLLRRVFSTPGNRRAEASRSTFLRRPSGHRDRLTSNKILVKLCSSMLKLTRILSTWGHTRRHNQSPSSITRRRERRKELSPTSTRNASGVVLQARWILKSQHKIISVPLDQTRIPQRAFYPSSSLGDIYMPVCLSILFPSHLIRPSHSALATLLPARFQTSAHTPC
mmetsp:Transcript_42339/g.133399  ORF Transcript_42339/g.133399 Transcript_42339/m.133399 type:complete len:203 (-) Transcript_42339:280-888(-)